MTKLTEIEIKDVLATHSDWTLDRGVLAREWTFKDFTEAMEFVNRIAALAETAGHHPDIEIRYSNVRLSLVSHDAGGLTERDASLATRIDAEF